MKRLILLVVLYLIGPIGSIAQCAMCRATVGSNLSEGRGQAIGTGINYGILYMLLIPYILVGVLIYLWFKHGKRELKEKQELASRLNEIYKK